MCRYLGEAGRESVISMGISVSSGYDVNHCFQDIPGHLMRRLLKLLKEFFLLPNLKILRDFNIEKFQELLNTEDLFEYFTLLRHFSSNFREASFDEYSDGVNPLNVSQNVSVPLLYVHSEDDPFFPPITVERVQSRMIKENPNIAFLITKCGGHICFYEGLNAVPWTDRLAFEVFKNKN